MEKSDFIVVICAATFVVVLGIVGELARLTKRVKRMEKIMAEEQKTLADLDNAIAESSLAANSLGELADQQQKTMAALVSKINNPAVTDYTAEVSKMNSLTTILKSVSDQMSAANAAGNSVFPAPSQTPQPPSTAPVGPDTAPNSPQPVEQTPTTTQNTEASSDDQVEVKDEDEDEEKDDEDKVG